MGSGDPNEHQFDASYHGQGAHTRILLLLFLLGGECHGYHILLTPKVLGHHVFIAENQ